MTYKIVWEEGGVYIKFTGIVDFDEFLNVNDLLYGKKEFDTIQYQLWDFTDINEKTCFNIENAEIISTLDKSAMKWNERIKIAVVTDNSSIIGFALKYKSDINKSKWTCDIFNTIKGAREWIEGKK
jgi:hypothetical protein